MHRASAAQMADWRGKEIKPVGVQDSIGEVNIRKELSPQWIYPHANNLDPFGCFGGGDALLSLAHAVSSPTATPAHSVPRIIRPLSAALCGERLSTAGRPLDA